MKLRFGAYGVSAGGGSYTLLEYRVVQEKEEGSKGKAPKPENVGKERESSVSFHGTLKSALLKILEHEIMDSEAQAVNDLIKHIDSAVTRIESAALQLSHVKAGKDEECT